MLNRSIRFLIGNRLAALNSKKIYQSAKPIKKVPDLSKIFFLNFRIITVQSFKIKFEISLKSIVDIKIIKYD